MVEKSQVDLKFLTTRAGVTQLPSNIERRVGVEGRSITQERGRLKEGEIISHTPRLRRRVAMGGEIRVGRIRDEWEEERRSIRRRNMSHTTITGGEEKLGVQAPDGRSGEGGRGIAVGGAPSRGQI